MFGKLNLNSYLICCLIFQVTFSFFSFNRVLALSLVGAINLKLTITPLPVYWEDMESPGECRECSSML